MTFLAPLAGIIAGVLGTIGVLVSYFLKLRRRPVRVASTLLWDQAVQDLQVNAPFRMLRASWLLLLQLLIVACVSMALARPSIEGDGPTAERVVLVVDASASMRAEDGANGSRFEEATRRALERIDKLPSGTQVMVIASAARAETAIGFTRDHGAAKGAVRAIGLTDQAGDLREAMRVVRALSRGSGETEDASLPVIYIYTDGADAPRGGLGVPVPESFVRIERVGPEAGVPVDNVGIGAIAARRDFEDPSLVRLFCRVVSARAEASEVSVRLLIDGEAVEAKSVEVPGRDEEGNAGEAPVTFELRDSDGGVALVSIAGEDALSSDDDAGLVLVAPEGARAAVVFPGATLTEEEEVLLFARESVGAREIEVLTAETYEERADDAAFLAGVDFVVFDGVTPDEMPPVPTIGFRDAGDEPLVRQRVAYWSRSHPLMRDINLGALVASAPDGYEPLRREGDRVEEIVAGRSSTLVAALERDGMRRVLVSFRRETSEWNDESYPLFVANAVDWLTNASARAAATSANTSSPASLFDDAIGNGTEVTLTGPGGVSRTGVGESSGRVVFGVLPRAGVYRAQLPGGGRTIVVNLASPDESALMTRDVPVIGGQSSPMAEGEGPPGTVEIWRWFILAAAALLAVEFVVYALKMRL